ncbi:MAG: hypothetical protein KDD11_06205 [Acidobacteria bacterium]|nr:hypothetical protein [Acidobacteriota bacterium]
MADALYTEDGVLAQMLIAIGQGMGPIRVSHDAAIRLSVINRGTICDDMLSSWGDLGTHVLEKSRAIGRKIASDLGSSGETVVSPELAERSCYEVMGRTRSKWCGREGDGG